MGGEAHFGDTPLELPGTVGVGSKSQILRSSVLCRIVLLGSGPSGGLFSCWYYLYCYVVEEGSHLVDDVEWRVHSKMEVSLLYWASAGGSCKEHQDGHDGFTLSEWRSSNVFPILTLYWALNKTGATRTGNGR